MPQDVLRTLAARQHPLVRLPQPPAPEDDLDMAERSTFAGADLVRMTARMNAALRRLRLAPDAALVMACPAPTLEQLVLWLAAVCGGHDVHVLDAGQAALPDAVGLVVCTPAQKGEWQPLAAAHGVKCATLGGHWQGSLFMLQMVQQAAADAAVTAASPGHTVFPGGRRVALPDLLDAAASLAARHRMRLAPALLVSLPALADAAFLATFLAALLHAEAPLYWLSPADRAEAVAQLSALPDDTLLLADAPLLEQLAAARGQASRLPRLRHVVVAPPP